MNLTKNFVKIVLQSAKDCLISNNSREIYDATGQDPAQSRVPGHSPFAGNRQYYNMNNVRQRRGSFTFQDPEDIFRHFVNSSVFSFLFLFDNFHVTHFLSFL